MPKYASWQTMWLHERYQVRAEPRPRISRPSSRRGPLHPPPRPPQEHKGQCGCFLVDTEMNVRYEESQREMACRHTLAADATERDLMNEDTSDGSSKPSSVRSKDGDDVKDRDYERLKMMNDARKKYNTYQENKQRFGSSNNDR